MLGMSHQNFLLLDAFIAIPAPDIVKSFQNGFGSVIARFVRPLPNEVGG